MISLNKYHQKQISSDKYLNQIHFPKLDHKAKPKRNFRSRYSHLSINRKKNYMQEVRYTEIERENRMLLEKIRNIIKKPYDISYRKNYYLNSNRSHSRRHFVGQSKSKVSNFEIDFSCDEGFHMPEALRARAVVVLQGKKVIANRCFNVKILELGEKVKIMVSDRNDTFRLMLRADEIFPDFACDGDWVAVLNCISMEDEQLVLCVKPYARDEERLI